MYDNGNTTFIYWLSTIFFVYYFKKEVLYYL
jgi:hypothetical protein